MPTRRALLGRIGLAVATAGLAGCGTTDSGPRSPADGEGSPGAGNGGDPGTRTNPYEANGASVVERLRHAVRATPVVAGETVYVATHGSGLYALDLASGDLRWHVDTTGTSSAPRVVDDVVYTGDFGPGETPSEILGSDGTAYAIDRHTGEIRWETTLQGSVVHIPVVREGTVYYGAQTYGLHAVDAETGERRWGLDLGPAGAYVGGLVVRDGVAYTAGRRRLFAVDLGSREVSWEADVGPLPRGVTLADGRVYAGIDDGVVSVRAETGESAWSADGWAATGPAVGSNVAAGNTVAGSTAAGSVATESVAESVTTGSTAAGSVEDAGIVTGRLQDPGVVSLDPATGDEHWRQTLPSTPARPVRDGQTLYVPTFDGTIHVVDGEGTVRSTATIDGGEATAETVTTTGPDDLRCTPNPHDGVLYLGNDGGVVVALDPDTGRARWRTSVEDAV